MRYGLELAVNPFDAKWCIYAWMKKATIGSDNGLLPDRHQAIIWTNADLL